MDRSSSAAHLRRPGWRGRAVRHAAAAGAVLCVAGSLAAPAFAQKWPDRPSRLVVQSPAGGTADLIARLVAQKLGEALGQPVVTDNRAGAAGVVSAEITARAAPDGYTLLLVGPPPLTTGVTLHEGKLSYNPQTDFTYIAMTGKVPVALAVLPAFPAKTFNEFVAYAKQKRGALNYGSAGTGSTNHITGELLKAQSGIEMTHVPFKGGAPAMTALLAGQLDMYIATLPTVMPMVETGRIRVIAVTSARRSAALPQVPTIAESGMPGFDMTSWFCILGPAKMPAAIVGRLNGEIVKILNAPETRERLIEAGVNVEPSTPEELRTFVMAEIEKMRKVVKSSRATVD
jgi:tripartite-type tricarboxylate transporter receptor subunit TctC